MDRNFHTDDFERLLREKSDEFRMYPSKRVWHSIYNNIHPGRKWPSVAMSITLISALLLIGYLNTNNPNMYSASGKNQVQPKISVIGNDSRLASNRIDYSTGSGETRGIISNEITSPAIGIILNNGPHKELPNTGTPVAIVPVDPKLSQPGYGQRSGVVKAAIHLPDDKVSYTPKASATVVLPELTMDRSILPGNSIIISIDNNDQTEVVTRAQKTAVKEIVETLVDYKNDWYEITKLNKIAVSIDGGNSELEKNLLAINSFNNRDNLSLEEKTWIENYALYNRPASKKWANKLAWQLYATPSVVYRVLFNDPNFGNTLSAPFALSGSGQDINKGLNQKPSLGFEIGTGFQYLISKRVKLTAGLQLNYTRYNSEAFQNTHPFTTKVTMHNYKTNTSYEEIRTTPYSNKSGLEAVKLHNQTFQISLPLGANLKIIGNDNFQWNFGITIQPTYVPMAKSYLISSDRRNYIKETSMINRWNLNAGFETFISFKSANGLTYQVGPQFRSQLFSTNSKQIAVEERLRNYGLKFGITKTLK